MKKTFRYLFMACCLACLTASCMDEDWDAPNTEASQCYGNNELTETNVMSIKDLKAKYKYALTSANDTARITDDIQIKGRVAGNDLGGNIYNEVALQDDNGDCILVCIAQGGLFGYLPVGQEILVNLKGLYIGNYGMQPQIGTSYSNSNGKTFPSRMSRALWQQHFKLIGKADASKVKVETFNKSRMNDADYVMACAGKLMTVNNVRMDVKSDTVKWAPEYDKDAGNGVSRSIYVNAGDSRSNSNFVVRTSTYAKFAAQSIPTGALNLTGIFTVYASNPSRYGYTWQILLRTDKDVEKAAQ